MYNDNLEYARTRLVDTIVRIGVEPFKVIDIQGVGKGMKVEGFFLRNQSAPHSCHIDNLNLEPVPLGYVNYNNDATYLVRKPVRNDWRQGLRAQNMRFIGQEGFRKFPYTQLRNTVLGIYPSFEVAKVMIQKGLITAAFSRDFAVGQHNTVLYKQKAVGTYDKLITLDERYNYLNEYVGEVLDGKRV